MCTSFEDKQKRLIECLAAFDRLAVALSGGVDSALLLAEAQAVLGNRVIAVTARSPIHPEREVADAVAIAEFLGVEHLIVDSRESEHADFLANPPERCYICKKVIFGQLISVVGKQGFSNLAHGANADDRGDYRPGMQAAEELGVAAPLMDAGLTKEDIRQMARQRRLFVWDKPSMACMATRFPYGSPILPDVVEQIKQAEAVLVDAGIEGGRVRYHGDVARVEVPLKHLTALVSDPLRMRVVERLRAIGFLHVSADLEGHISGSMNRPLAKRTDSGGAIDTAHANRNTDD